MRDLVARTTRLASVNGTSQAATDSDRPAIAANGSLVAFVFTDGATRLVSGDTNAQPDVHAKEFAPTDVTGPALILTGPADGASESGETIAVGGTATDPSGVVSVSVNGAALPLTAGGGFSAAIPAIVGANAVTVRALDGSGNLTSTTRTVNRPSVLVVAPAPRINRARLLGLSASSRTRGRKTLVRVKVRVSANAKIRVFLFRRTIAGSKRRVVLRRVGGAATRRLKAGRRTVTLKRSRLKPGRYVVRVRILSRSAGPVKRTVALRVRRR